MGKPLDQGRRAPGFSRTTLYTTLSPCDVCATLLYMRQFARVVVGDVTSASGNEGLLRAKGVKVDVMEDQDGIALYDKYGGIVPTSIWRIGRGWRPVRTADRFVITR